MHAFTLRARISAHGIEETRGCGGVMNDFKVILLERSAARSGLASRLIRFALHLA